MGNTVSNRSVPEITPLELVRTLEEGVDVQIIDMRAASGGGGVQAGFLPEENTRTIVGSKLLRITNLAETGIDPATPVVVICAHGNDSRFGAMHLNRIGANARSLSGGMAAWMNVSVPRVLKPTLSLDRLVQFDRVGKESLSYLLISAGEAMIIDPPRDYTAHLRSIEESGARLIAVADTHVHADYISGAPFIAREREIPYYLHPADMVYPYDGTPGLLEVKEVFDGTIIRLGRCQLIARHTPGHSPGSVTYLIGQDAAFTGDFIFLTSIGRPDLAEKTDEWSAMLWKSIQAVKKTWDPAMMIYPAHYTSQTTRTSGGTINRSLGHLLRDNPGLSTDDEAGFFSWIRGNVATAPSVYRTIKGVNVGLVFVNDQEAEVLENGKNQCAVGGQ